MKDPLCVHQGSINLPPLLPALIQAQNTRDTPTVLACFAEDAVVQDEGKDHHGLPAIHQWSNAGFAKFQYTIEPTAISEADGKTILTATIAGNFPGSTISLDFHFTVKGSKIAALIID